ncbi:hypothetical protein AAFC00_000920 [Neodothiora populina]|uniref:Zn(2)-C6 fungal-type domain-containing protein n=1 Tax=Neodothiora populina TaxID=2781224 RepID=A0ABR3PM64_9PEZI
MGDDHDAASAPKATRAAKRSWSGCARCKKRRQKCDEVRPACSRCTAADVDCVYEVKLRWGGRSFAQSRFGECLSGTSDKVEKLGNPNNFVYVSNFQVQPPSADATSVKSRPAVANKTARSRKPSQVAAAATQPVTAIVPVSRTTRSPTVELGSPLFLCPEIDPFCNFSDIDRALLDHFVHSTSNIISCHSIVQENVCQVIVPAALENPTLFYATMALSAIHQKSQAGLVSAEVRRDPLVIHLLGNSLHRLQGELIQQDAKKSSVLLATIRTLFLCEVHSGGDRPGTWRAHFEGAKVLMHRIESWKGYSAKERDSTAYFLKRWYNMTESFVALTGDSLATGQLARFEPRTLNGDGESDIFLDEYAGFTTDLTSIFCEIGACAWERRKARLVEQGSTILSEMDLDEEAMYLEQSIWDRIEYNKISPPSFRPGLDEKLSHRQKEDFLLCNEAWHHMALIYIHRQISGMPAFAAAVQESVKRILDCIEGITATAGLTPLVVLTTPLFAAGCEALGDDRQRVRELLLNMFELLRIPNIYRSLEVLESFWASQCETADWDIFMKAQHWDFLPY